MWNIFITRSISSVTPTKKNPPHKSTQVHPSTQSHQSTQRHKSIEEIIYYECISPETERSEKGLKILTPKQMLQRLPTALPKIKSGNASENLLNEIRQIIYLSHRADEFTEKIYTNIISSIHSLYIMDTIFMNSENSKTLNPYRLILNLTDKINLKRNDEYVAISINKNNKYKLSALT